MQKRLHWFIIAAIALVFLVLNTPLPTWSMSPVEPDLQLHPRPAGGDDNSIGGHIRETGTPLAGITVRLAFTTAPNTPIQTVTTAADGSYTFTAVSNGMYIVRPEDAAYDFDPPQRAVTVFYGNVVNQDFNAIFREYDVDGRVLDDGTGLTNIVVRLFDLPDTTTPIQSVVTNSQGGFVFIDIPPGNYRVLPESTAYTFVPTFRDFSVTTAPITLEDFEANLNTYDTGGRVSDNGTGLPNVQVALAKTSNPETILQTVLTNGNGNYAFTNIEPETYRITPTLADYLFVPDYRDIIITTSDVPNVHFEANLNIFDASGRITDNGVPLGQVQVRLSTQSDPNTPIAFASTDSNGDYTFVGIDPGNYRVTPSRGGYDFTPDFRNFTISNAPVTGLDFEADLLTYSASGRVENNGDGLAGVTVNLSLATNPNPIATVETDADGNFAFNALSSNEYRVTAVLHPYGFEPPHIDFSIGIGDVPDLFFEANISYLYLPLARRSQSAPVPTPTPSPTAVPCQPEIEPNSLAEAVNNGAFVPGRCINGALPTEDQNDFYRIEFPGGTFNSNLTNIPTGTDFDLTLYRLNGSQAELVAFSNNNGTQNENIRVESLTAGTYYIGVQKFGQGSSSSLYTLLWTQTP